MERNAGFPTIKQKEAGVARREGGGRKVAEIELRTGLPRGGGLVASRGSDQHMNTLPTLLVVAASARSRQYGDGSQTGWLPSPDGCGWPTAAEGRGFKAGGGTVRKTKV